MIYNKNKKKVYQQPRARNGQQHGKRACSVMAGGEAKMRLTLEIYKNMKDKT